MKAKKWMAGAAALTLALSGCGNSDEVIKVEHELGDPITLEDIIKEDASKAKIVDCDEILEQYLDLDDEDDFLPIGVYKITVKQHFSKTNYKVKVKDTKKPEWKRFSKTVKCKKGKKVYNWGPYFKAKDLSNVVYIEVDDDDVDYDEVGVYPITVTAKDASDNKITKKSKVEIVDGEVENEFDDEEDMDFNSDIFTKDDMTSNTPDTNHGSDTDTSTKPENVDPSAGFTSIDEAHAYAKHAMNDMIHNQGWAGATYSIGQEYKNGKIYYTVTISEVKKEDINSNNEE